MKHSWIVWIIIALIAGAAVYYFVGNPAPIKQATAGVRGTVTIGPVCPVQRIPPDPNCADRAHKADFNITDASGSVVSKVSSGLDGKFEANLSPGKYVITPISTGVLPRASAQDFIVPEDGFVEITIQFDSGIR
ncbi:MAG: hypothetical protein Q8L24_00515 [bacterium]|nr:hypothetical protein [bacterium]